MTMTGIDRDAHDLSQLLANAHRTLDQRGVPHAEPAPSNASLMLTGQERRNGKPGRKPGPIPHGTQYGYNRRECRCDECRRAHAEYRARQRARTGRDEPAPTDGRCRCTCGHEAPTRTKLAQHTWDAHERPPHPAEKVLLDAERAA